MSYVFDVNGETVWSPSLRVGDLYVRMAREVGSVLGVTTGLNPLALDMWDVDINTFEGFVRLMHETYFTSGHPVLKGLLEGVLAPSIVILERGGGEIILGTTEEREFRDRALAMPMARR
ncbi:hypothetical protein DFR70_103367 [Nocardia tenerifensis]|uniref:Uncharacterized protein n=1 Tax=Nocardia tenerifensis TaxID=228006 RepID=A0A318K7T6_9NOCA|nr:DUF6086 family protein [Nocardia tenerifensis]PXX66618.1 hypothetical protein DFR70_103367 [Nocardia tenerifensis]